MTNTYVKATEPNNEIVQIRTLLPLGSDTAVMPKITTSAIYTDNNEGITYCSFTNEDGIVTDRPLKVKYNRVVKKKMVYITYKNNDYVLMQ